MNFLYMQLFIILSVVNIGLVGEVLALHSPGLFAPQFESMLILKLKYFFADDLNKL